MIKVVEIVREIADMASELYQENYENAKSVHFFADTFLATAGELSIRGQSSIGAKNKYPAILLFCDNIQERHENLKQWQIEAALHILIVDNAVPDGNGDVQREKIFYPILYPIFNCFLEAIHAHPQVFTMGDTLKYDKFDRLFLNATIGKDKLFADLLDGIELRNLKLKIKEKSCL